jgi:hypothetical protein
MPKPLPTVAELRRRLSYNPETGLLTWLPRTPDMFAGATVAARRKTCACWNGRFAGKPALIGIDVSGYLNGPVMGKYVKAHRVAWALHYGEWPKQKVSQRNGDHRDNRISNLRDVDHQTCHQNAKLSKRNKSGAAGVNWHKRTQRWCAFIRRDGKTKALGSFATFDEAAAVRKAAEADLGYAESHGSPRTFANRFVKRAERIA